MNKPPEIKREYHSSLFQEFKEIIWYFYEKQLIKYRHNNYIFMWERCSLLYRHQEMRPVPHSLISQNPLEMDKYNKFE